MYVLSARIILPLIIVFLAGAGTPARAEINVCEYYCSKQSNLTCFGLAVYLLADPPGGLGCTGKEKQEPCASAIKQVQFICPAPHERSMVLVTGKVCSEKWQTLCYGILGKKPPPPPARAKQKQPDGAKTAVNCAPNMVASGKGCVPKLDMPGFDTSPGSTPGAGRPASVGPSGGGTPAGRR